MELDPLWHRNEYRDSNYIRDLTVNLGNPEQWIYAQSILRPGESWEILWLVDQKNRKKTRLDSTYYGAYSQLNFGGRYVSYKIRGVCYLLNISSMDVIETSKKNIISISADGEHVVYYEDRECYILNTSTNKTTHNWNEENMLSSPVWIDSTRIYSLNKNSDGFKELRQVTIVENSIEPLFSMPLLPNGLFTNCMSFNDNRILMTRHYEINIDNQSHKEFFPYCERQYFEKIIPLVKTKEYLVVKEYYETIEPKTTLWYQHFHVFDENWENERRVTLNFDF